MAAAENHIRIINPPSGYAPVVARWVWALEDTRLRTKSLLVDLSQEELEWVPREGGNSIGTILYHLAAIEMSYLYEDILEVGWAAELESLLPYNVRDERGSLVAVESESPEVHLDRLDATRHLTMRYLLTISEDELYRVCIVAEYETTPEWVLQHLMQHEAEYRGQIGELRMNVRQHTQ